MATVYILYSESIDLFYVGSCLNFTTRLTQHNKGIFDTSFTHRAKDWTVFFVIEDLDYQMARNIEKHIKAMKSRTYYLNLKKYPEISEKLILKYSAGSSR
jgi:putative endonuclease